MYWSGLNGWGPYLETMLMQRISFPDNYVLEVSSPGISWQLITDRVYIF